MSAPSYDGHFATDATFAADGDSWSGDPTKVDPGAGRKAEGFEPDTLPAEWLNWILNNHGEWAIWLEAERARIAAIVDPPGSLKTFQIDASAFAIRDNSGTPDTGWDVQADGSGLVSRAANNYAIYDLNQILPTGATVQRIKALVDPQSANGSGNRIEMSLNKVVRDFGTPAAPTITIEVARTGAVTNVATMQDDGGTSVQVLDTGALAAPRAIDRAAHSLVVIVRSSNTVGSDKFHGISVTCVLPAVTNT